MYTLGIPDRQKRRTLGYLKQQWIDFEEHPAMDGFFDLTEKKIMKLTDLITEDFSKNLDESDSDSIVQALQNILQTWQSKRYADDKSRWESYYMDIEELVQDFEEERAMDTPAPSQLANLQETKVRKAIRKLIRQ